MRKKQLWLIGGTQESAVLAQAIAQVGLLCVVSVTTETARSLYPTAPNLTIWVGYLTATSLPTFLQTHQIGAILDASHPFAVEISQLAIAAAQADQLPYLRYERPAVAGKTREGSPGNHTADSSIVYLDRLEDLLTGNYLAGQRVLLTLGYRSLPLFQPWQERALLFARILPSVTALAAALQAGFTSDRLIALRPPISAELEQALWQQWQITTVVTKASGAVGGELIKRQVATALNLPLIVIGRPEVTYPQQTSDLLVALEFCRQHST
ncbi:cobalt-precorrin-6A reductase [Pantanalinema sp. GBBB05]|uniref:cobalt-precorrin-6A reductase n=1 Tax=Pantanalinema sp. GBBB05 TaxID=2604139 RepID=UPI001E0936C8|nr:cobalt-precorrin-6A reductase [Pantanalinema sp. GBBB05]